MATRGDFLVDPALLAYGPAVLPDDPRIVTIGRSGQIFTWPGSELRARFMGEAIAVELRTEGEVHFNVEIDGALHLLSARNDRPHRYALEGLGPGPHLLRLIKRTEAAAGVAQLLALYPATHGELLAPPLLPTRRLEFIGDSMTVGACVFEDGAEHWERRESHDHSASFAALTAAALHAQHRAIAVSGVGVSLSTVEVRAEQLIARLRPEKEDVLASDAEWQPDAVVVLLGHNDVIAARRVGRAFPSSFVADYVRLIRAIRSRYPSSLILCATGGMYHSICSRALRRAFAAAMVALQASDSRILAHRFRAYSFLHPRAHTQAQLAEELRPILAARLGW